MSAGDRNTRQRQQVCLCMCVFPCAIVSLSYSFLSSNSFSDKHFLSFILLCYSFASFLFIQFPSSFTTQSVCTAPSLSLALCISLSKSSLSSSLVLMLSSSCFLRSCTAVSSSCRAWRRWALQKHTRTCTEWGSSFKYFHLIKIISLFSPVAMMFCHGAHYPYLSCSFTVLTRLEYSCCSALSALFRASCSCCKAIRLGKALRET